MPSGFQGTVEGFLSMGESSCSAIGTMNGSLWKDLAPELVEMVVPFLPIASICRARAVCKRWNELVGHPDFALRNAQVSSPGEYVLITVRGDAVLVPRGWDVIDVANKRFFTFNDDFLTEYVESRIGFLGLLKNFRERITLAADGGLFFIAYSTGLQRGSLLFVCNPILRTIRQIPHLVFNWQLDFQRDHDFRGPKVVMTTDRFSMEYDIFVFDTSNKLHIYESKTTFWREPLNLPQGIIRHSASVFINKKLHVLFQHRDRSEKGILCFDKLTSAWLDYGVELPGHDMPFPVNPPSGDTHLVLSGEKLFYILIGFRGLENPDKEKLEIFDVNLSSRECTRFATMPRDLVRWIMYDEIKRDHARGADLLVVGCTEFILFSSCTGQSVIYNFSKNIWNLYTDNKLKEVYENNPQTSYLQLICGSNHCFGFVAP